MRIEQLKHLLEIRDNHSISKTAENNYISTQALSKSIKSLEQEIGQPLYRYTQKKVFLTPAGLTVCKYAEIICSQVEAMKAELSSDTPKASAPADIRFLSFTALSNLFMHTSYSFFLKANANINVTLQNITSYTFSSAMKAIKETPCDIIFLSINASYLPRLLENIGEDIHSYDTLMEDEIIVAANKSANISMEDIRITLESNTHQNIRATVFSLLPNDRYVTAGNYFSISSDVELQKNLLQNSSIITAIPDFIAKHFFKSSKYRFIPLTRPFPLLHLCIYKTPPLPEVKYYIDYLKIYLKSI